MKPDRRPTRAHVKAQTSISAPEHPSARPRMRLSLILVISPLRAFGPNGLHESHRRGLHRAGKRHNPHRCRCRRRRTPETDTLSEHTVNLSAQTPAVPPPICNCSFL